MLTLLKPTRETLWASWSVMLQLHFGGIIMNNYKYALVFTKKGNLEDYYANKFDSPGPNCPAARIEREIQCVVYYRWDQSNLLCHIKCPINPLPVKGEFQAPALNVIKRWFASDGWTLKATIPV